MASPEKIFISFLFSIIFIDMYFFGVIPILFQKFDPYLLFEACLKYFEVDYFTSSMYTFLFWIFFVGMTICIVSWSPCTMCLTSLCHVDFTWIILQMVFHYWFWKQGMINTMFAFNWKFFTLWLCLYHQHHYCLIHLHTLGKQKPQC